MPFGKKKKHEVPNIDDLPDIPDYDDKSEDLVKGPQKPMKKDDGKDAVRVITTEELRTRQTEIILQYLDLILDEQRKTRTVIESMKEE